MAINPEVKPSLYKIFNAAITAAKDSVVQTTPVTVPMTSTAAVVTPSTTTSGGIFSATVATGTAATFTVSSTPATKTATASSVWTSAQKTEEAKTIQTKQTEIKKDETKAENAKAQTATKNKRTIDEAMKASYKNWNKMSKEEKEKKIIKHLTSIDKNEFDYLATKNQPDGRIGWLKSFLLNNRMSKEESKTVIGALKQLNVSEEEFAELQAQGVKMAFDDDNLNKESCQLQVAEDISAYGIKAKIVAVDKTSTSQFDSVKLKGSEQVSKLDEEIHAESAKKYLEGSKTSSQKVQDKIGANLVEQYGDFAKSAEVDIHKIISEMGSSKIQKYAAENIYKFDAKNQANAFQVTMNTKNEEAIKAATSNWEKYDEKAKPAISNKVYNSDYSCAKEILSQKGINENTYSKEEVQKSLEFSSASADSAQTSAKLSEAIKNNDTETILKMVQKGNIDLKLLPKASVPGVIKVLLANNPSVEVYSQAMQMIGELQGQEKQELISVLGSSTYGKTVFESKLYVQNEQTQIAAINSGYTAGVNVRLLSPEAQKVYKQHLKERGQEI